MLTAWFFLTPVVYDASAVPERLRVVFDLNPATPFVQAYRDAIYDLTTPPATRVAVCLAIGVVTFAVGYLGFRRLDRTVVEEL